MRTLLGLFIVLQLVYLAAGNIATFVRIAVFQREPVSQGHTIDQIEKVVQFYGNATGQRQDWYLFAGLFPERTLTLEAHLSTPDSSAKMILYRPPTGEDGRWYRWPASDTRLINIENAIGRLAWICCEADLQAQPEEWQRRFREWTSEYRQLYRCYARWRLAEALDRFPERTVPQRVEIIARLKQPGQPAVRLPLALWQPARPHDLDWYDPVTRRYLPLVGSEP